MGHFDTLKAKEAILINLRAIMDERGLSYSDLGDLMGVSKQRVSDIFNRDEMSLKTIGNIAKALKIDETDLTSDPALLNIKKQFIK